MGLGGIGAFVYTLLLLLAALSKLDGWARWRATARQLAPRRRGVAALLTYGLPVVELSVAAAVAARPTAGLVAAALLLTALAAGVFALAPSHAGTECRCFGALATSRLGHGLGYRNLVLAAGALVAALVALADETRALTAEDLVVLGAVGLAVALVAEFRQFSARSTVLGR